MSTTVTYSDEELATLTQIRVAKLRDNFSKATRFADKVLSRPPMDDGGKQINIPFKYRRHSAPTRVRTGFEQVNLSFQPNMISMIAGLGCTVRPAGIGLIDDITNRGKEAVLNLATERAADAERGHMEDFEQQFLQSGVTALADFISVNGDDDTTGIVESAAVGSQDNTIQGISKSTYSTLPGMQNQIYDAGGSFATGGMIGLDSIQSNVRNALNAGDADWLAFCTLQFSQNWNRVNSSLEQYVNVAGQKQAGGAEYGAQIEFLVKGFKTTVSRYMPTAGTATTTKPWSWLLIDFNSIIWRGRKGYVKQVTPWTSMNPAGNLARVMWITTAGQMTFENLETSGVLVDAQTW